MPIEEVVVPFQTSRASVTRAYGVRGTVLVTSLRALRARDLLEPYLLKLDARQRDRVMAVAAATWVPVDVAVDHYAACNALDLARSTIEEIGGEAGRFINETVVGVIVRRFGREAGANPWLAFGQADRLISRTWQGTAIAVTKLGPKEARLEWIGQPLAVFPYFRTAYKGFIRGIMTLFCDVAFVREIPSLCNETSLAYRCSWV